MIYPFLVMCLTLGATLCQAGDVFLTTDYLEGKICQGCLRYKTFLDAMQLMEQRNVQMIVETGTARGGLSNCLGDGCSTVIFSEWARDHNATVYSVDISADALRSAKNALGTNSGSVIFVQSDSIEFLRNFNQPIDFLYLDSYDYTWYNPLPSQNHHLQEIIAAYPWLTENTVVMIDDCDLPNGGKGKLVIQYLLEKGWKIISKGYQVVLVQ